MMGTLILLAMYTLRPSTEDRQLAKQGWDDLLSGKMKFSAESQTSETSNAS